MAAIAQDVLPCSRSKPGEDIMATAQRCLVQKLNVPEGTVELNWGVVKSFDSYEPGTFYPGLGTLVRRHIVQGKILQQHTDKLKRTSMLQWLEPTFQTMVQGQAYTWKWTQPERVPSVAENLAWLNDDPKLQERKHISE